MGSFKVFLAEQATLPHYVNSIRYELTQLKATLWDQQLTLPIMVEHLSSVLNKYLIRLVEEYDEHPTSEYAGVGLNGATMSPSGWITVNYTTYLEDVLNADGREYYEDFVRLFIALVGHELAHREQVLKSSHNFHNPPDPEHIDSYLKDHRELDAYAVQAALELLAQFNVADILSKLKTSRGINELSLYSEGLKWYVYTFDSGPVMQKFLKKLYELLTTED